MRTQDDASGPVEPVGAALPLGTRFVGPEDGARPNWLPGREHPAPDDLAS